MSGHRRRGWASRGRGVVLALVVGLGALLLVVPPASAQESGPAVEITGIDVSDFPTVRLRFAVAPGVASSELDAAAIDVTENGAPVDEVVTPLSDQAIAVMLVIDTSGSMAGDPINQAKLAALDLLDVLPPSAQVGLVGFGDTAELLSGFTDDRDATRSAINGLQAIGGTALYDAVTLAAQQTVASDAERTALVVLSDGADTDSQTDVTGAGESLAATDGDVFVVALQSGDADAAALASLADAGDGRVVSAADPDALSAAYADLGQRIVNQYQVEFVSSTPAATGVFTIEVAGNQTQTEIALPDRPSGSTDSDDGTAAPRPLPEPLVTEVDPAPLEQSWVLYVGAALVGLAIAVTAVLVAPTSEQRRVARRSLRSDAAPVNEGNVVQRAVGSVRAAATRLSTQAVERTESSGRIDAALDRAGIVMRSGEFVALVGAISIGAAALLYLLFGVVLAALGLLVPIFGSGAFLRLMAERRNSKFADQLSDTLLVMAGSLRSGFGVGQAIDTVAEEMDPPISVEFRRAILEMRLGREVEEALEEVAKRVQNEDFEWVVDAMRINRQVGGDLAAILDQVSETIRARNRLKRQVSALTAEGRISALVLGVLPIGLGVVLYTSNPDYMDPLFNRTGGRIMLGIGVVLMVAGAVWLRKLIDVEY